MSTINPDDDFLVQRGTDSYILPASSLFSTIDPATDWMLIQRGDISYKVSAADVQSQLGGGSSGDLYAGLPPFAARSGPGATLSNEEGKIEFSLDGTNFSSTLVVPNETIYYCDWTNDIKSASQGSDYSATVIVAYTDLSLTENVEIAIKIDKLPDPFEFTDLVDVDSDTEYESNTISPLATINAPTSVWGSSDAVDALIAIGSGNWRSIPAAPNSLYVNRSERIRIKHKTGNAPSTAYSTTLNVGYGTVPGAFESSTYTTTTLNSVVNQPDITSPSNNEGVDAETFTVTASPFVSVNAGDHEQTHWQVARDAGFTDIVEESTTTSDLTSWTPTFRLSYVDQLAYVRVKYMGSLNDIWSNWSDPVQFTPQQWWLWRVQLKLKGGNGAPGPRNQGGNGGAGKWTMDTSDFSFVPPDSISGTLGGAASGRSGGGGYGRGGSGQQCNQSAGMGGGGSSSMLISGTILAVAGGGGGGGGGDNNNGSGGNGGYPGVAGNGGAGHDTSPGGTGGGVGSGAGAGQDGRCGQNDLRGGGAGGGGGGGGGKGEGDTPSQSTVSGGGGGGGGYYSASASANWTGSSVSNITGNGGEVPSGLDNNVGWMQVILYRAPHSNPTGWIQQGEYKRAGSSYSVTLSGLKT